MKIELSLRGYLCTYRMIFCLFFSYFENVQSVFPNSDICYSFSKLYYYLVKSVQVKNWVKRYFYGRDIGIIEYSKRLAHNCFRYFVSLKIGIQIRSYLYLMYLKIQIGLIILILFIFHFPILCYTGHTYLQLHCNQLFSLDIFSLLPILIHIIMYQTTKVKREGGFEIPKMFILV